MTPKQIRLYFYWYQREIARQQRVDRIAVEAGAGRAIMRTVFGKDPDGV